MVKGFNFPFDYVLYDLSYSNLILLGATLPSYDAEKKKGGRQTGKRLDEEVINASDPKNRKRVKDFFNSIN